MATPDRRPIRFFNFSYRDFPANLRMPSSPSFLNARARRHAPAVDPHAAASTYQGAPWWCRATMPTTKRSLPNGRTRKEESRIPIRKGPKYPMWNRKWTSAPKNFMFNEMKSGGRASNGRRNISSGRDKCHPEDTTGLLSLLEGGFFS